MIKILLLKLSILIVFFITNPSLAEVNISHAIAMHGEPKYEVNFKHVDYANPNAQKGGKVIFSAIGSYDCLLYTSPSPRDRQKSRMPSSA